jgi:CheY-like chemotaxis protein
MKTVLLVEDDSTFQFISKILFRSIGLPPENLTIASSVHEAFVFLDKCQAENKPLPDLILLDLYLPDVDGFGFLEAYAKKDYPNKSSINLIVLTSSQDHGDIQRIKQLGVTKYMSKPLKEEIIKAELGL